MDASELMKEAIDIHIHRGNHHHGADESCKSAGAAGAVKVYFLKRRIPCQ